MRKIRMYRSVCALFLSAWFGAAGAQSLQPFQQDALDKILQSVEPALRPMMRAQIAPTLAMLNEEQVAMMLASMTSESQQPDASVEQPQDDTPASAEDLAYNRAQFEPIIQRSWEAAKAFDDFVAAKLAEHCPSGRDFAVFGSAWRYEVYPLAPIWPKASINSALDVQIIGGSYPPQDGRYDFDFSDVRFTFDSAAVESGIAAACGEYAEIGEAFLRDARANAAGNEVPPNGMQLEGSANAKVDRVRTELESLLQTEAPGGNNAVFTALLNGRRVDSK